jgi:transcriptional regulator with XRE-family HTH domain
MDHPLRQYRAARKLTRDALAYQLGVTGTTIYRWETGERSIRRTLLPRIKEETGIDPAAIFAFEARKAMEAA